MEIWMFLDNFPAFIEMDLGRHEQTSYRRPGSCLYLLLLFASQRLFVEGLQYFLSL